MPLVPQAAAPSTDARVAAVAYALGERYVVQAAAAGSAFTISDPGPGVALGNAAHMIASNWLIAVATGRRLVIRSPILRGLFPPVLWYSATDAYSRSTCYCDVLGSRAAAGSLPVP